MALGEARAVGTENGGEVRKRGRLPAESAIDGKLARGVGNVVVAANDVGDGHQVIINDHGIVVVRIAAGAHQDGIANDLAGKIGGAVHEVVP